MADTHSKEVRSKICHISEAQILSPKKLFESICFPADFGTERMYENFQNVQISYFLNIKRLSS